jgi:hypothetical protein
MGEKDYKHVAPLEREQLPESPSVVESANDKSTPGFSSAVSA